MSDEAITRRLKTVDQLRELCLSLMKAKKVSDEKAKAAKKPIVKKTVNVESPTSEEFDGMEVEIIDYEPRYRREFTDMNIEWISHYFTVEPHDLEQLENPEEYILAKGGQIFFARCGDEIVGTAALIKNSETVYEIAKMAVKPAFKGLGAGEKLGRHLIGAAKNAGCNRLFLESNQQLIPALALYKKLGFTEVPVGETLYSRVNYKAEMYF